MRTREMQPVLLLKISSFIRYTCVSWETGGDGLETASEVSKMIHLRLWMRARTKSPSNDSLFALLAIVKFDPYHDWSVETPGLGWIQRLTFPPAFIVQSPRERRDERVHRGQVSPTLLAPQMVSQRNMLNDTPGWHDTTRRADTHQHQNQTQCDNHITTSGDFTSIYKQTDCHPGPHICHCLHCVTQLVTRDTLSRDMSHTL